MNNLIACLVLAMSLSLPAFAETTVPNRESREVGTFAWLAVIPVAANIPGGFGAHFKTRVVIFNPTPRDYSTTAVMYGGNGQVSHRAISMDTNTYNSYDNYLEEVFNYRGSGRIWLRAPDQEDAFYGADLAVVHRPTGHASPATTVFCKRLNN